ncbi:MAG: 2-C-methyl-D-erythritol 4-phosphate cytidylyltransferase [Sphingobacteriales bacterium]|nr:MAG: 2-C-methyl-D-erythritol 4-phosphate cytidylyltransferase [Sphingobacteriales bacterium]
MDTPKFYAVIVAGGSGTRMQTTTPKQFLLLKGIPVLMHTILKFANNKYQPKIILVLAQEHLAIWANLVEQFSFKTEITVISGGKERFHSVKNSLSFIPENAIVAIHDGVRPLLSDNLISTSYQIALEKNNAVCAIPSKDSVRILDNEFGSKMLPRQQVFLIQTPQVFNSNQLKKAYSQEFQPDFTDDASVVQHAGFTINLISGEANNIKITHPIDLQIAEIVL